MIGKEKLKILFYGMSIHPGNFIYFFFIFIVPLAGSLNEDYSGTDSMIFCGIIFTIMFVIFAPLYIYTSYDVGKINYKNKDDNTTKGTATD